MKTKCLPLILLFLFYSLFSYSDNNQLDSQDPTQITEISPSLFSIHLVPGIDIPLGENAEYLSYAGTFKLSVEYRLPAFPSLYLMSSIGYHFQPIGNFDLNNTDRSFSLLSAQGGLGLNFDFTPWFGLKVYASGGYYYGFLNDSSRFVGGGDPICSAGGGFYLLLTPGFSLFLGASYYNYLNFFDGIDASLGIGFHFTRSKKPSIKGTMPEITPLKEKPKELEGLEIGDIEFENLFPVFHKYYDDHPVGKVVLHNPEDFPITDIKINLVIKEYMNAPKECKVITELGPGQSQEIELYALFANRILGITEATKASAELIVEYKLKGKRYSNKRVETIRLYDRNAITWDDDRKAAAFVTAKDPLLLNFSKNVLSMVKEKGNQAINENLRAAIAFHEGLSIYGMAYVVDPKTPYTEFSKNKNVVDFLQFPRQTLQYKAGDCDDLSILYSALFESVGIETAFITIPGHIFMAFSAGIKPDTARKSFLRPDDLIFRDDKTWIPVEVTEIDGGFLKAWGLGAKQWREYSASERAVIFPVHESWKLYEPVAFSDTVTDIILPEENRVVKAYLEELEIFIEGEIFPRGDEIRAEMKKTGKTPRIVNRLGVLYAKYGLLERAEKEFSKILEQMEYVPALVNLGNIYYLREEFKKALEYYNRAYREDPTNSKALLFIARVHHELENYGLTREMYSRLKEIDPNLALQFSYLDLKGEEAIRSAEISKVKGAIIWEED